MLPTFPEQRKLRLSDKKYIELFTRQFPPYADFNFGSLWSYNTESDYLLSQLNDNLVLRFRDYVTNKPFYSFIGTSEKIKTIETLLAYSSANGFGPKLKLIPHFSLPEEYDRRKFSIKKDLANFDYVLSLKSLFLLKGGKLENKRWHVNKFKREYPMYTVQILNLSDSKSVKEIFNLFTVWALKKEKNSEESSHEFIALQRLITDSHAFDLHTIGVFVNNTLIGFAVTEKTYNKYIIGHFMKCDPDYKGCVEILYHEVAKYFLKYNYVYLNYENDLGLPHLRVSKRSWKPTRYLRKYEITLHQK